MLLETAFEVLWTSHHFLFTISLPVYREHVIILLFDYHAGLKLLHQRLPAMVNCSSYGK